MERQQAAKNDARSAILPKGYRGPFANRAAGYHA